MPLDTIFSSCIHGKVTHWNEYWQWFKSQIPYDHINPFIWNLNHYAKKFLKNVQLLQIFKIRLSQALTSGIACYRCVCKDTNYPKINQIPAVFRFLPSNLQATAPAPVPGPHDIHNLDYQRNRDNERGQWRQKRNKKISHFERPLPTPIKAVVDKPHNLPCWQFLPNEWFQRFLHSSTMFKRPHTW